MIKSPWDLRAGRAYFLVSQICLCAREKYYQEKTTPVRPVPAPPARGGDAEPRILAAEQRPVVAHGATVGFQSENKSSPGRGERKPAKSVQIFSAAPAGAGSLFHRLTHGFTVGYFLSLLRNFWAGTRCNGPFCFTPLPLRPPKISSRKNHPGRGPSRRTRRAAFTPLQLTPVSPRRKFLTPSPVRTLKRAEARAPFLSPSAGLVPLLR